MCVAAQGVNTLLLVVLPGTLRLLVYSPFRQCEQVLCALVLQFLLTDSGQT